MSQPGHSIVDFVQRFQELQRHRDSTESLIRDLLVYSDRVESSLHLQNTKLLDELQLCKLDLADATNSRRDLQQRLQTSEARCEWFVKENEELKVLQSIALAGHAGVRLRSRNSYILVVIDGDSLVFRERWMQQGAEGGRRAAQALLSAIAEHCDDRSGNVDIVTKVVVDLGSLAKALGREVRLDVLADVRDFAAGFSQARASVDFIDVGHDKDAASSKLKGVSTETVGCMLAQPVADLTRWHLRNYNCRHVLLGISHDAAYAPFLEEMLADDNTRQCIAVIEGAPTAKELVATGVHVLDIGKDLFRTEPYMQVPPQQPDWNPGPRGLDEPITVSVQALEYIKKRKDKEKLCNNHFLRGPCTKGDACHFYHNYKPSADEINAISVLARQNPCTNGQDCVQEDCIYGHHCPSIKDAMCCHPFCKFAEDAHPPGTRFKNVHIRAN
ncbi:C-x8-C-x5-C-x3-H type zinc finger protein [Ophiocordyceps sinensis CO18]|uniref:C-x8-C-x5-C-x3-H type zinc finger protein n=1 Tax=Ophiocordyceps sinensis (strain Co18 / CGMCC 3.14243) TaxID=911162 RepID=T5A4E9_OPHSC|nr:C-x8-C-x5-C-x3-H type zinc finger protein [Ophiocordyceps sinensis CO18]